MTNNVSLVRIEGPTSIYIEASIDADGDLVVSELREHLEPKGIPAESSSF